MGRRPISRQDKFAQATALWLFASLLSIPLWDLAWMLFQSLWAGHFLEALAEIFLKPGGTLFGLMLMFGIVAEHGVGSIAERYWPAVLIASAFTAWFLSYWWRSDEATMNPSSLPLHQKFGQAAALWMWSAFVGILVAEPAFLTPSCLLSVLRIDQLGLCFTAGTFAMPLDSTMAARYDLAFVAVRYWPSLLVATVFTTVFLWWWWRHN